MRPITHVCDIPEDFAFVSDSQEVEQIKLYLGNPSAASYQSFFVQIEDGEYKAIYGLYSSVPYIYNRVEKVL